MQSTLQLRPAPLANYARAALLALACTLLLPLAAAAEPAAPAQKTLYERLGGYDALSAVTKDWPAGSSPTPSSRASGRTAARTASTARCS